ncbi:hypothetical protein [Enterobacter ludwigii]|uniref:hypothetical protein n=1 Tax=Enterobacter ludwigii TaxID=299767 RepID=UPI000694EF0A|nr:hypothetical protein [Enterobacter ludwigii]AOT44066.1 hypothetical protein BH714_12760 [Enterobacter ludwigii]QWZ68050.1 hypothetical protein I6L66_20170 [Enterobacter ludwigii]
MTKKVTIYEFAQAEMNLLVNAMLELAERTGNFINPPTEIWSDHVSTEMLLCGKGYHIDDIAELPSFENAWVARLAFPFSIETAATGSLYRRIESFTDDLISTAYQESNNFQNIQPVWIKENPQFLPVYMHVAGSFSKQELRKRIGSASDNSISKPASEKIAAMLTAAARASVIDQDRVKERIKATVEGIVRDLVGRLLLEQFVASALSRHKVPFKRENEYRNLEGVVYDFRADFVVPNEQEPMAFLEVRKSSSRHASLYAKDKMFSAINWKGKHPKCLGVLIIDGPWTEVTIKIMSRIFDYVIPINQVDEVAAKIRAYLDGDEAVLQWLVDFKIMRYNPGRAPELAPKVELSPDELEDNSEI